MHETRPFSIKGHGRRTVRSNAETHNDARLATNPLARVECCDEIQQTDSVVAYFDTHNTKRIDRHNTP